MINHHGINYFYAGSKGKIRMQAIAASLFLQHDGVNTVVFQGKVGKYLTTYRVSTVVFTAYE